MPPLVDLGKKAFKEDFLILPFTFRSDNCHQLALQHILPANVDMQATVNKVNQCQWVQNFIHIKDWPRK